MPNSLQDLIPGLDPSGFTTLTAAQLLTLVQAATPNADKGMVLVSFDLNGLPDVPDALTNGKWTKYLWMRVQNVSIIVYGWNPNIPADSTYQQWQPITSANIPNGAITNAMLAANAVTFDKILSVNWSQLVGVPASFPASGGAGGDLAGTYPNPTIAVGAITTSKIAPKAITNALLADVTSGQPAVDIGNNLIIAGQFAAKQNVRVNDAGTGLTAETKLITQIAEPQVGDVGKLIQVATGPAYQYVPFTSVRRVLRILEAYDNTAANTALDMPYNAVPTNATGAPITTLSLAINPLAPDSTFFIEASILLEPYVAAGLVRVAAAMFINGATNAAAVGGFQLSIGASSVYQLAAVPLRATYTPGNNSPIAITFNFGGYTGGASAVNYNPAGHNWGGALKSWVRATEYSAI